MDIFTGDPNQGKFQLSSQFNRIITILQFFHEFSQFGEFPNQNQTIFFVIKSTQILVTLLYYLLANSGPINNSWSDDIVELENDETVGQVGIEPVNVWWNTQWIHPVAVRFLFASLFDEIHTLE